eukprot:5842809-Heterocapsa_arctica.AAC.1
MSPAAGAYPAMPALPMVHALPQGRGLAAVAVGPEALYLAAGPLPGAAPALRPLALPWRPPLQGGLPPLAPGSPR